MTERELGIIISKLDALHEDIREVKDAQIIHGNRINSLENFKSWSVGVGSLCVLVVTTFIGFFKNGG